MRTLRINKNQVSCVAFAQIAAAAHLEQFSRRMTHDFNQSFKGQLALEYTLQGALQCILDERNA
ncbi:hypothetical protein D3C80_1672540 [compost metagenome]